MATKELSRLDLRIPRKQKDYFEQALEIGGFRSLTDFIISAVSEKAEAVRISRSNLWYQRFGRANAELRTLYLVECFKG